MLDERSRSMKTSDLLARISIDPNVCFGKPCIRGHRIWVSLVLDLLADGLTVPDILAEYPGLVEADVRLHRLRRGNVPRALR